MSTIIPRGVKKTSELSIQKGRSLVISEEDASQLSWEDIPNGSLKINPITGIMSVKLEGENDWCPAGIKNDGTLSIAKDAIIKTEVFTITDLPAWNETEGHYTIDEQGNTVFGYQNESGVKRKGTITEYGTVLNFTLIDGSYQMERNHLEVSLDGILSRSAANGGLVETSETTFSLNERLEVGQTVEVRYVRTVRIGNPYPRMFLTKETPAEAEVGDMWLDYDDTVETAQEVLLVEDREAMINWNRISNKPTTMAGFASTSEFSAEGHHHKVSDIDDFPAWVINNSKIDAYTVRGYAPGVNANNICLLNSSGKVETSCIPTHEHSLANLKCFHVGAEAPTDPVNYGTIWFCTAAGDVTIKLYADGQWKRFGAWN